VRQRLHALVDAQQHARQAVGQARLPVRGQLLRKGRRRDLRESVRAGGEGGMTSSTASLPAEAAGTRTLAMRLSRVTGGGTGPAGGWSGGRRLPSKGLLHAVQQREQLLAGACGEEAVPSAPRPAARWRRCGRGATPPRRGSASTGSRRSTALFALKSKRRPSGMWSAPGRSSAASAPLPVARGQLPVPLLDAMYSWNMSAETSSAARTRAMAMERSARLARSVGRTRRRYSGRGRCRRSWKRGSLVSSPQDCRRASQTRPASSL